MNARTSALTLTDTAAARKTPRVVTPQARTFQQLGQTWNNLSGSEKGTWELLAQQNANPVVNGVPPRATGWATFIGHNAVLYTVGQPIALVAPPRQDAPPLPAVTLSAAFNTGLSLLLQAHAPYPARVLIYGAKPMLAPRAVYDKTPFRLLGVVNGLSASVDLTAFYAARYRVLTPGYKIALHLVGLSDAGFRTAPLFVAAVADAPDGPPALSLR